MCGLEPLPQINLYVLPLKDLNIFTSLCAKAEVYGCCNGSYNVSVSSDHHSLRLSTNELVRSIILAFELFLKRILILDLPRISELKCNFNCIACYSCFYGTLYFWISLFSPVALISAIILNQLRLITPVHFSPLSF